MLLRLYGLSWLARGRVWAPGHDVRCNDETHSAVALFERIVWRELHFPGKVLNRHAFFSPAIDPNMRAPLLVVRPSDLRLPKPFPASCALFFDDLIATLDRCVKLVCCCSWS